MRLVTTKDLSPSSSFWTYLKNVAIMHTGKPGFKHRAHRPDLRVEYIHMGALLGYVIDIVVGKFIHLFQSNHLAPELILKNKKLILYRSCNGYGY